MSFPWRIIKIVLVDNKFIFFSENRIVKFDKLKKLSPLKLFKTSQKQSGPQAQNTATKLKKQWIAQHAIQSIALHTSTVMLSTLVNLRTLWPSDLDNIRGMWEIKMLNTLLVPTLTRGGNALKICKYYYLKNSFYWWKGEVKNVHQLIQHKL